MTPRTHIPGDRSVGCGGPADAAPDEHPEDGAGHHDPGDHNGESKELRMVADGSLLGRPITGGSGTCAMGDGQEARRWQGGYLSKARRGCAQRMNTEDAGESSAPGTGLNNVDRLMSWPKEFFGRGITDHVYLVSTIEGELVAMGVTVADRDTENENSRRGSTPTALRL